MNTLTTLNDISITSDIKYYRIEINYKNHNMPDDWLTIETANTLAEAQDKLLARKENLPKTVPLRITLIIESATVVKMY